MKRLLTLSIIALAALLFWGSQAWENKKAITNLEASDPHYIDIFINDFTITTMNENGTPGAIVKATRFEHYNDNDYAIIHEPQIELIQSEQQWRITAQTGEISDNSQQILLRGNVILQQQGKPQPVRLETEQLIINTDKQIVKSTQAVRIIQQEFDLKSIGMILNNSTGKIELLSSVEGIYVQTP